ncbi:MAG: tRNA preQ1(34) S-adenosylmethionine ribosyltransferase-isomerase QueA [Alphaproteobacteria bacterium]|jgi:S-adenosylmethionine:tRNA ribosyltransferase-isomerase|nr:tRNA preQ1(34) S-adenosylmethionine ribosyltransferase-isomerase QueA [Alphaproteobacteria bacterium]
MRVDLFDYELPPELIAKHPARPRDSARLLDITGPALADRSIRDLPDLLRPGDLLVVNDTRVIPSRLDGRRGEARVEATLHKRVGSGRWAAFAKPAKRLRPGDTVNFGEDLTAEVISRDGGEVVLDFSLTDHALLERLHALGRMPLPPYIKRGAENQENDDKNDYKTVFADKDGAVAAPTASLHFTPELLAALEERGIDRATVTLHVGAGTFLPVTVDDTDDHPMHTEWAEVGQDTVNMIAGTKARGGRIVAVGTTSLRVLESAARGGSLKPFSNETDLFITPGFEFQVIDLLLTNFHLPRSTLLMLVSAIAGRERVLAAYEHAIQEKYRFFSYGDACLMGRPGL